MFYGTDIDTRYDFIESNNCDGVTTIWFGHNGTITFLSNDKSIVDSAKIKENETYYPFISYNDSYDAEFHLIVAFK